jgi:hypothetical protein
VVHADSSSGRDGRRIGPDLDEEQLARYRAANNYAARFCHALRDRLVDNGGAALSELRRFFRLPMTDKISHIHSRTL